jgi:sulfur-oxidizing protein SoxY
LLAFRNLEDKTMTLSRREFVCTTGCAALATTATAAGLLVPSRASAALPRETYGAQSLGEAVNAVLGTSQMPSDEDVHLSVPELVEVADYVPVSVDTALDNVQSITLAFEHNPNPIIASFQLDPQLVPYVATRVRLAEAGDLHGLVKAGDFVHRATKKVAVTIGGCGDPEAGTETRPPAKIPAKNVLLRTRKAADGLIIRTLITHPMTPPLVNDPTAGNPDSGHFIQEVTAVVNGKAVLRGDWSAGVSQNPYLSFKVRDAKAGDTLGIRWVDNQGMSGASNIEV